MLKLNDIKPAAGSRKVGKRKGKGQGTGNGCTAGKGDKGQWARTGSRYKLYFEGGQTPMTRRIPKRGFNNANFKKNYQLVNVGTLEKADVNGKEIDRQWLFDNGFVRSNDTPVKVLGNGELSKKVVIRAECFSKSARDKIEKAKGKAEVIARA